MAAGRRPIGASDVVMKAGAGRIAAKIDSERRRAVGNEEEMR